MPKKLNYLQAHKNKKPKKLPPKQPTREQIDLCIAYFETELLKLSKSIGFKFNDKNINK